MRTVMPVQPARIEGGVLQFLDIDASPPVWRAKLCPYQLQRNGSRPCANDCALFWYAESNRVALLCAGVTIALHEQNIPLSQHAVGSLAD